MMQVFGSPDAGFPDTFTVSRLSRLRRVPTWENIRFLFVSVVVGGLRARTVDLVVRLRTTGLMLSLMKKVPAEDLQHSGRVVRLGPSLLSESRVSVCH